MKLDLLRHGLTALNAEGRFNGWRDDGLTEGQTRALCNVRFDATRYDAVFCSPLARCMETARCLRIADYRIEPRIAERRLGIFEGHTPAECAERYPKDFARFRRLDAEYQIPNGESRAENLARVTSWLEELSTFSSVLAITHGGTIDFLYRLATGRGLHGGEVIFAGGNASLSEFELAWPDVRLLGYDAPL